MFENGYMCSTQAAQKPMPNEEKKWFTEKNLNACTLVFVLQAKIHKEW